jgi:hypothetical protein
VGNTDGPQVHYPTIVYYILWEILMKLMYSMQHCFLTVKCFHLAQCCCLEIEIAGMYELIRMFEKILFTSPQPVTGLGQTPAMWKSEIFLESQLFQQERREGRVSLNDCLTSDPSVDRLQFGKKTDV